ncbi:hypothetical protein [Pseudonocardia alni]|uniref:hypothetical protein n=1 Tax=Pseudonocardia alni TaxID=33907 RepID=UPI0033F5CF02
MTGPGRRVDPAAWDLEVGRRCLAALGPDRVDELLALDPGDVVAWLDRHLPDHRDLVRAAFRDVSGR